MRRRKLHARAAAGAWAAFALVITTGCESPAPSAADAYRTSAPARSPVVPDADALPRALGALNATTAVAPLEELSGARATSVDGGAAVLAERGSASGRRQAQRWLFERFAATGLETRELPFTHEGEAGVNVEAVLRGAPGGRHLYVTAHYDSVGNAGADDNASGVVALLTAARALAPYASRDTVHFVAFDLEESGYHGSLAYVDQLVRPLRAADPDQVIGNINLDMVGHDAQGLRRATLSRCEDTTGLAAAFRDAIDEQGLDLTADEKDCDGKSDHLSFRAQGIPSVFVLDDDWYGLYPWYHQPTDTADRITPEYFAEMCRALAAAVFRLAF